MYDYTDIILPHRDFPERIEFAERLWDLYDHIVEYRSTFDPYSDEAERLAGIVRCVGRAAGACELGNIDRAAELLGEAKDIAYGGLADAIKVAISLLSGHPLECGCVLPEQSCTACRAAMWEMEVCNG